jgi:hypothetical protein
LLKNLQKWTVFCFFSYTGTYELPDPDPAKKDPDPDQQHWLQISACRQEGENYSFPVRARVVVFLFQPQVIREEDGKAIERVRPVNIATK